VDVLGGGNSAPSIQVLQQAAKQAPAGGLQECVRRSNRASSIRPALQSGKTLLEPFVAAA